MMFDSYKLKVLVKWPWIRAHLCTLAVAFSFNSTWFIPRYSFRYGPLTYGLLLNIALLLLALPATLLQLAVGQLSQQDAVGVWRAVPFFKGIGYLRLLICFIISLYSIINMTMSAVFFFYALSNSIPFSECKYNINNEEQQSLIIYNATTCFSKTFLSPVSEQSEYYIATALVAVFLWILFPFALYTPVKSLKRIFYVLGPVVPILLIIIVFNIGNKDSFERFIEVTDWSNFLYPNIWNSAIAQTFLSTQIAGGYLISAGDIVYSNVDVEWTTYILIAANIFSVWFGLIFWSALADSERDSSPLAMIAQTYNIAIERELNIIWPLLIFATLFLSGVITMVSLLYPLYDRFRRISFQKWRYLAIGTSVLGAALTLIILAYHSSLVTLQDFVIPYLVNITTILEISAFIFIYGWKVLFEDIAFLIGRQLNMFWVCGWCAVPGIIAPFLAWWYVSQFLNEPNWTTSPWDGSALVTATAITIIVVIAFSIFSITRQVQYDVIGKLKSSFLPSRHWGPRDPITHYYWRSRLEELDPNAPRSRYNRRQLGQFSGTSSLGSISKIENINVNREIKRRSNSDDWLYNYRKNYLTEMFNIHYCTRKRSKSLDWAKLPELTNKTVYEKHKNIESSNTTPTHSIIVVEENIKVESATK